MVERATSVFMGDRRHVGVGRGMWSAVTLLGASLETPLAMWRPPKPFRDGPLLGAMSCDHCACIVRCSCLTLYYTLPGGMDDAVMR
jgi:hypothetical protein